MSTKKIYIAGKVSGLPYAECSQKFGAYEVKLLRQGHKPVVPLNLVNRTDTWEVAMRKCIAELVTCDEAHFLPCWVDSPGAKLEHMIAERLKIPVVFVDCQSARPW